MATVLLDAGKQRTVGKRGPTKYLSDRFEVRVPQRDFELLNELVVDTGVSRSALVRTAVSEWLQRQLDKNTLSLDEKLDRFEGELDGGDTP